MTIIDYKHTFKIENEEIKVVINHINEYWMCRLISGNSGISNMSGGAYKDVYHYIEHIEKEHRYSYNFAKYGYKHAKEQLTK